VAIVSTPLSTARFPALIKPDDKYGLVYQSQQIISPSEDEQAAEFIQILEELAEDALNRFREFLKSKGGKQAAAAKKLELNLPFDDDYDKEGEETGDIVFKVKSKCQVDEDENPLPPRYAFFDSKGTQIKKFGSLKIWGGAKLRLDIMAKPYCMPSTNKAGVTLYISAVQVIEASGGGSGGNSFGVEEGGYEYEEDSAPYDSQESDGGSDDEDSDF
jgi:hypothetical protein